MGLYKNLGACIYCRALRKIHPVGQGAMYSETFFKCERLKFVVLYDCGTSTKGTYLGKEIDSLPNVDYVFVSHFHYDHISGMERVIKKMKPSKVFLPYITPSQFILDLVYNAIEAVSGTDSIAFMLRVLPYLSDGEGGAGYPQFEVVRNDRTITIELDGDNGIYWSYDILMESHLDPMVEKLKKDILDLLSLPLESDVEKFQTADWYDRLLEALKDKDKKKKIKDLYGEAFPEGHNSYSMIVHSHRYGASGGTNCTCSNSCVFGCIYTGDAELSEMMAHRIIDSAPKYIQIPHHGSGKNHNPWIYHEFQEAFISAGEKNRFCHPSQKVLDDIVKIGARYHLITEKSSGYVADAILL